MHKSGSIWPGWFTDVLYAVEVLFVLLVIAALVAGLYISTRAVVRSLHR